MLLPVLQNVRDLVTLLVFLHVDAAEHFDQVRRFIFLHDEVAIEEGDSFLLVGHLSVTSQPSNFADGLEHVFVVGHSHLIRRQRHDEAGALLNLCLLQRNLTLGFGATKQARPEEADAHLLFLLHYRLVNFLRHLLLELDVGLYHWRGCGWQLSLRFL